MGNIVKEAIADLVVTSMWIFTMPVSRIFTTILASNFGIQPTSLSGLFTNSLSSSLLLIVFSLISAALGGASFNPATTVAFVAAGKKPGSSLLSSAVRFPAQAAGGLAGVKAILGLVPTELRERLRGPSLQTDLHTGAFAEGALTFTFCFSVLLIVFKGPTNPFLKVWLMSNVTAGLAIAGSGYSGPSMNPANAFGWAYANKRHDTWQHYYVYWACPLVGAILAAWVFKVLVPNNTPEVTKEKKKE